MGAGQAETHFRRAPGLPPLGTSIVRGAIAGARSLDGRPRVVQAGGAAGGGRSLEDAIGALAEGALGARAMRRAARAGEGIFLFLGGMHAGGQKPARQNDAKGLVGEIAAGAAWRSAALACRPAQSGGARARARPRDRHCNAQGRPALGLRAKATARVAAWQGRAARRVCRDCRRAPAGRRPPHRARALAAAQGVRGGGRAGRHRRSAAEGQDHWRGPVGPKRACLCDRGARRAARDGRGAGRAGPRPAGRTGRARTACPCGRRAGRAGPRPGRAAGRGGARVGRRVRHCGLRGAAALLIGRRR